MTGRDDGGPIEAELDPADDTHRPGRWAGLRPFVATTAAVVVIALVAWALHSADGGARSDRRTPVTTAPDRISTDRGDARARQLVAAAVATTTAAGSFHVAYHLTEHSVQTPTTQPCSAAPGPVRRITSSNGVAAYATVVGPVCALQPADVTVTGDATVNTSPFAMRASSDVSNFGPVTLVVDGANVWEYTGTYSATGQTPSPQQLTSFAGLVESTLGQREGALAVQSLASPNGYLGITKATIADATPVGTGVFDGMPVTNYRVTLDPAATPSGVTAEEAAAIAAARQVLAQEGFVHTVQDVSVDAAGFIRHTHSVAMFADGGTMTTDDTFSQFGCAGTVAVPGVSDATPAGPPDCVVLPPAPTSPTTAAPAPTTVPRAATTSTSTSTDTSATTATSTVSAPSSAPTTTSTG